MTVKPLALVVGGMILGGVCLAAADVGPRAELAYHYPKVEKFGKVVRFESAVQQPRDGSKLVVDLTSGGDATKLNPGIEKVARFVNIYAGAGKAPAEVQIAVVLHGEATLACLKPDEYAERFGTTGNPSSECIEKLTAAGVEFYVCGQSLAGMKQHPGDVEPNVAVAVSALTSLVNLQADGYSYVPLGR